MTLVWKRSLSVESALEIAAKIVESIKILRFILAKTIVGAFLNNID